MSISKVSPAEMAEAYRGRRVELRKEYETTKDLERKKFLKSVLLSHANLMKQNTKPIKSYLWKVEKNGNYGFLFGDIHATLQKFEGGEEIACSNDLSAWCKSHFHPQVWSAFESCEKCYIEYFNLKHNDEVQKTHLELKTKYKLEDDYRLESKLDTKDPMADIFFDSLLGTCMGGGLVDLLLAGKVGKNVSMGDMVQQLDSFVVEIDTTSIQKEAIEIGYKLQAEGKLTASKEWSLEPLDAAQMGNLDSLTLIHQELPPDMVANFDNRNVPYARYVIDSLDKGEKGFFGPGAAHYVGDKGILRLLSDQGVTVTQIELN